MFVSECDTFYSQIFTYVARIQRTTLRRLVRVKAKQKCNGPKRIFATAISITWYTYFQSFCITLPLTFLVINKTRGLKLNAQSKTYRREKKPNDKFRRRHTHTSNQICASSAIDIILNYTQITFTVTENSKCKCVRHTLIYLFKQIGTHLAFKLSAI